MVQFPSTHWSLVLATATPDAQRSAFGELARRYRPAIVAYFRTWLAADAAEDATQSFLADSFENAWWSHASAERGSFRSYLRMLLRRHGPKAAIDLPSADIDPESLPDVAHSAEQQFDLRFALLLTAQALDALGKEYATRGRGSDFERLQPLLASPPEHGELKRLAAELGMPANTLTIELQRLRQRLRRTLRSQAEQLCADAASFEAEWEALQGILSGN